MSGGINTSFRLDCTPSEIDLVEQAMACFDAMCIGWMSPSDLVDAALTDSERQGHRMAGIRRALQVHIGTKTGLTLVRMEDHAIVHGSGILNLAAMSEILRLFVRRILPIRIDWTSTFDPMRPGSALGGWIVVHSHRSVTGDTRSAAGEEIRRVSRRKEPTDVQMKAMTAYGKDDGDLLLLTMQEADGDIGDHLLTVEGKDTLAAFVYIETGDAENASEAADMLRSAADQLEAVATALDEGEE